MSVWTSAPPLIQVTGLSFTYARAAERALDGLDLTIEPGEWLALAGATGAGKSTLCLALTGLIPNLVRGEMEGSVRVRGQLTTEHRACELARHVGLVFQDYTTQLFASTVALEIAFPLENLAVPPEEMRPRVEETLATLDLTALRDRSPRSLSGGQQQRVAIASVLGFRPAVLVLDEAFTDLDPHTRRALLAQLNHLREADGIAVLTVERETEQLLGADRLALMKGGRIVACGAPGEVLADAERCRAAEVQPDPLAEILAAAGLEPAVVPPPEAAARLQATGALREREAIMAGLRAADEARASAWGEPVIEAAGVVYAYPESDADALCGVDLVVREREVVALVGPNGSGKSTLGKLLTGLIAPAAGTVRVRGLEPAAAGPAAMADQIGMIFQDPDHQIFCERVEDEVAFALRQARFPEEEVHRRVEAALAAVGLIDQRDADPFSLPRGLRQLTTVASALARQPRCLILDEPVTGLDAEDVARLMGLVQDLNAAGHTLLIITHSMPLAAAFADRIVTLSAGQVVLDAPTREAFADPERIQALGLDVPRVVALGQALGIPFLAKEEVLAALGSLGVVPPSGGL